MEVLGSFATGFTLAYLWMTVIAVKNITVDQKATTPKEFWIWVGLGTSIWMAIKYLS